MPAHPAIEFNQVTKIFSSGGRLLGPAPHTVTALKSVDLTVRPGEIFGLVGESGSGKTTAGRLMVRLETPDQGSIRIMGRSISRLRGGDLKRFRRRVQMIFQDPYQSLNPYMSVSDTVAEPLQIHYRLNRAALSQRVAETLELVGLTPVAHFLNRYPHQLSGGQRQRVAIARVMVLEPQVVVADEPTSMLDASIAIQIFRILTDIQNRRRTTWVLITHSLAAAHYICDRLAVIYHGRIVETGPARSVIGAPRHPYTRALLDALPKYGHVRAEKRYATLRRRPRAQASEQGCIFFSRCNRAAEDCCTEQVPPLRSVGRDHQVACHLIDGRPNGCRTARG